LSSITYPDGEKLLQAYDGSVLSQISSAVTSDVYIDQVRLHESGQTQQLRFAKSGVVTSYTYEDGLEVNADGTTTRETQRLNAITTKKADGTVLQNLVYSIDDAGNPTHIKDAEGYLSQILTYDSVHRLTQSASSGLLNFATQVFDYSPAGNLKTMTQSAGSSASFPAFGTRSLSYATNLGDQVSHRSDSLGAGGSTDYTYDAEGNIKRSVGPTHRPDLHLWCRKRNADLLRIWRAERRCQSELSLRRKWPASAQDGDACGGWCGNRGSFLPDRGLRVGARHSIA
jgi:hypothetical protein